jgi:hypothetical protein
LRWDFHPERKQYRERIESLGSTRWQQIIYDTYRFGYFYEVEGLIRKYEKMEAISLLEMGLWKANIVADGCFNSMIEMREYPILDENFDPNEYAMTKRITCGSAVIIPLVINFLW